MATWGGRSKVSECEENHSAGKGQHIPKEGKKKRRNKAKEKNKPTSEVKKRGHPSTPSNSDDSERPRTEDRANTEKSSDPNEAKKSQTKERGSRKSRKCKTTPPVVEEDPVPPREDKAELSSQAQESLRWEGVLEDPVAEAERMEVYRANRRSRYMASRQTLLGNICVDVPPDLDVSKLGRVQKASATAKIM